MLARRYPDKVREWLWRGACLVIVIPASLFVLWSGAGGTWSSIAQMEHFPETMNPGYFLVRIAAFVLAALMLVQAVLDLFSARRAPS